MTDAIKNAKAGLQPCPFCGGPAGRVDIPVSTGPDEDDPNAGGSYIECTRCHCCTMIEFGRKENLVSSWNARQGVPALAAELEAALERERVLRTRADAFDHIMANPDMRVVVNGNHVQGCSCPPCCALSWNQPGEADQPGKAPTS